MPTKPANILVIGGAGFIGSHMAMVLMKAGYTVIVLDNLSKGYQDAISGCKFIAGDMGDKKCLAEIFDTYSIAAVMHFGAFIEVGESVKLPGKYYQNNLAATLNLLDVMLAHKVKNIVFSSTAAVYGEPQFTPINESHPLAPINPYGRSKWMVEQIIQDYARSDDLHYAILRYFNAAGADPAGLLGERHDPESHLIPIILQVAMQQRESLTLYGNDYSTPDGTCIRDYVHVMDLCDAHLLALKKLLANEPNIICNLGTGQGFSVQEVIKAAESVTGKKIPITIGKKREGDPAILVADPTLAKKNLQWEPKYTDLSIIVQHAWQFLQRR